MVGMMTLFPCIRACIRIGITCPRR
jgi:hypothetical protein